MKYLLALSVVCLSNSVLSAPLCTDANSDPDGDGWGWENGDSCMMPMATSPVTVTNTGALSACLADGNALEAEITSLRSQIAALQSGTSSSSVACEDTAPIGDGWGWDGVQSCRVEQPANSFDNSPTNISCAESARRIREDVRLGMTPSEVIAILGEPPAIFGETWYYNNGATAWPLVSFDDNCFGIYCPVLTYNSTSYTVNSKNGTDIQCGIF